MKTKKCKCGSYLIYVGIQEEEGYLHSCISCDNEEFYKEIVATDIPDEENVKKEQVYG